MPIIEFASQSQKDEWLPKMINGEIRSCFAVTEPNTGLGECFTALNRSCLLIALSGRDTEDQDEGDERRRRIRHLGTKDLDVFGSSGLACSATSTDIGAARGQVSIPWPLFILDTPAEEALHSAQLKRRQCIAARD